LSYPDGKDVLRVDFGNGSIDLGLTARLYGYDSKKFEMNAEFADGTADAEIEVKLQSFKNVTVCSFGIIKSQDGIYCHIGDKKLRIANVCERFTVKALYKDSVLSLTADYGVISCPSVIDDYPADGICNACIEAKTPCALDIYSVAFHLDD
jgi:hypothetical protein